MNEHSHSGPSHYFVFGVLVVAFAISLVIGSLYQSPVAIASIYIIATLKAFMVIHYFVHLRLEPRWVKYLVISLLLLLAVLFVGLYYDIVSVYGRIDAGGV